MRQSIIPDICQTIENELVRFYGFKPHTRAADHLLPNTDSKNDRRAQVLFQHEPHQDEIFIGIQIREDILQTLEKQNPQKELTHENLDAFCVLTEEISHLHLILNRASCGRSVYQVELEWQGEIDKVLTSAILLKRLYGDPHWRHLIQMNFENSVVLPGPDASIYHMANRLAARFWDDLLTYGDGLHDPANSRHLKGILQTAYDQTWGEKIEGMQSHLELKKTA